jgi:hypothetical protein
MLVRSVNSGMKFQIVFDARLDMVCLFTGHNIYDDASLFIYFMGNNMDTSSTYSHFLFSREIIRCHKKYKCTATRKQIHRLRSENQNTKIKNNRADHLNQTRQTVNHAFYLLLQYSPSILIVSYRTSRHPLSISK